MVKISNKHKIILCYASFISAVVTGLLGLFLPPAGVIDSSVLFFVAQLLLLVGSILGLDLHYSNYGATKSNKNTEETE